MSKWENIDNGFFGNESIESVVASKQTLDKQKQSTHNTQEIEVRHACPTWIEYKHVQMMHMEVA